MSNDDGIPGYEPPTEEEVQALDRRTSALFAEMKKRAEEVGWEQCAEEYWGRAKADMNAWVTEIHAYRKANGIQNDEL